MSKKKDLRKVADEAATTAADRANKVLEDLVDLVAPLVKDAKHQVQPIVKESQRRIAPIADEAKQRVTPLLHDAAEKVGPVVDNARDQLLAAYEHQVRPKLSQWWDAAQDNDFVSEATNRGAAAVAALRGDNYLRRPVEVPKPAFLEPPARRKHLGRKIFTGLGIAALVAGVVVALRELLLPKDDGWTPHEPSHAYDSTAKAQDVQTAAQDSDQDADAVMNDEGAPVAEHADETTNDDQKPADENASSDTNPFRYGEGSFIGANPPEGYTIKGNERSMKYHTSDGPGYERTIPDVWFNSEQAAEEAGFTRASR